jgi:2-(1,2-epoxy-1,2-dihydrophenyl)acetyl-CoA isomerase
MPSTTPTVCREMDGSVAIITLNRPAAANTLDLQCAVELLAIATGCRQDAAVRAIVLTGAGRNFCFGGDLRGMRAQGGDIQSYLTELTGILHAAIVEFVEMRAPVIAAVNGTAAGAGVGLIAMSDLAICGKTSKFNAAYTGVGLTPDAGTSYFLPRTIGAKRSLEMLLLNRVLSAAEALDWGLVNAVVEDSQLLEETMRMAHLLSSGPTDAFGKTKRLVRESIGTLASHLSLEGQTIASQATTAEGREGIEAFLQKRAPKFT